MAVMEGPLSKWTNVVKGWQYRWFVLDDNAGLLSYYTSKDKMKRGSRRGCVRLKGAVIGIDDEDDSTFTITVDHKTFHFQARDAEEREQWIEALENTIVRHTRHSSFRGQQAGVPSAADFDRKLAETDAYLQLLINQVESLEKRIEACEDVGEKEKYNVIKVTANAMIEAIKHSIVMLQISKETLKEPLLNGTMHEPVLTMGADFDYYSSGAQPIGSTSRSTTPDINEPAILNGDLNHESMGGITPENGDDLPETEPSVPATSYSSSEDEDFYDAEEETQKTPKNSPDKKNKLKQLPEEQGLEASKTQSLESVEPGSEPTESTDTKSSSVQQVAVIQDDYTDELYDATEEEGLGSLEKHGSIITHLLSQVRIGMDLTKVVLPTFILERKSLLEMYAEFFAHADLFLKVPDLQTPKERMVQLVRWYMSAFHASRNSDIAKKPYNPILGETFKCYWNVPGYEKTEELVEDGPLPWASGNNLSFIAEQVSHHPPISAFYAEHANKRITLDGYIWTKSKFLGLSIGVHMIGQAVISLLDWDEEYIITFPNGYGRSILTVPWVELGGNITVSCPKTGYNATVDFLTKPFYGGKKHRIAGNIYAPNEKKPFCVLDGEWNGTVWAKYTTGMNEAFVDTKKLPIIKKAVKPRETQDEFESRRLWQEVTINLRNDNVEKATEYKQKLEQRQREEAKERKEKGLKVETKHFHEEGEHWVYDRPLVKRIGKNSNSGSAV
ncbi:LOW QUALITY PROTEIN: oxysterol-binding protein-related protein 9-like [Ruditapes philippinarum]|uniref:LOW QUALITY PROTEIN: oxysterol-binding protein-related protein 9-like n=1 Tax=Ruditapes philippinarum TaxID=129788 RepID=UPI00295ABD03|nr:LOW QUALITY PROTEIN: oxysterol-binding protein-related protein 9-like [Ruditapes philippinarum]